MPTLVHRWQCAGLAYDAARVESTYSALRVSVTRDKLPQRVQDVLQVWEVDPMRTSLLLPCVLQNIQRNKLQYRRGVSMLHAMVYDAIVLRVIN